MQSDRIVMSTGPRSTLALITLIVTLLSAQIYNGAVVVLLLTAVGFMIDYIDGTID